MDALLELGGVWLARAYAFYGVWLLLVPAFFFIDLALLAAVVWAAVSHLRGRQPWPNLPPFARRWGRLGVEIKFGLIALILALYQNQWEATNQEWSLRGRPDILATLYQIGFARSKPHGAPRSNAFGSRVRQVYEQPWLGELLYATPRPPG